MSFFRFFRRTKPAIKQPASENLLDHPAQMDPIGATRSNELDVRRYFHNQQHFQCYTSWFAHWDGWISAGHCLTEAQDHLPDFVESQSIVKWPDGLDAALVGCRLPQTRPKDPVIGQEVIMQGFPAGSRNMEHRAGQVYFERSPGQWIAHIFDPDEPVVTGMSGGSVLDAKTGRPIGIIITRNSPADLNNDRDPDESADFIALSSVWDAVKVQASV
ncbi:trypsin-like peptidase domain-containing protein [Litorimonas cladophorae]|nr:trypsin-like peptidase domain-containing protein [Litorimonas cladophorae]